tara:strand:- start:1971 stop:2645 length:675 start_codon:yes stop_codon:yes gene_type:complete
MIDTNLKKMTTFNKKLLDQLKQKHNVTMDQIIKQIKPKKEFSNWKVKISRLINKKDTDPSHFGFLELSENLADFFNFISADPEKLSPTAFIDKDYWINCVGECVDTGEIILYKTKWKVKVPKYLSHLEAYYVRQGARRGKIRLAPKLSLTNFKADYSFSIIKQKRTNKLFYGYLKPLSNGKVNICDFSAIKDKLEVLYPNMEYHSKAPIIHTFQPREQDWELVK